MPYFCLHFLSLTFRRHEGHSRRDLAWLQSEVLHPLAAALSLAGENARLQEALCAAASEILTPDDLGASSEKAVGPTGGGGGSSKKKSHGKKHKGGKRH